MKPWILLLAAALLGDAAPSGTSTSVSLPLEFEVNQGQFEPGVLYLARTASHFVYLTRDGMTVGLLDSNLAGSSLRMNLAGTRGAVAVNGEGRLHGVSNYLIGNNPAAWRRDVPHFARVRYAGVWPGIDLVFHGHGQSLEYDFTVGPGADPSVIQLVFEHAVSLRVDPNGDLVIGASQGEVRQRLPEVYQEVNGTRRAIRGGYRIIGGREVRFEVAAFDRRRALVIDPVLSYSTYIGGTGIIRPAGLAVDSSGNAYVTGQVQSPDFPTAGPIQSPAGTVGLYRTQNQGNTWSAPNSVAGPVKVQALSTDPNNIAVVYAGTNHGLLKSADGGVTWSVMTNGLAGNAVSGVAVNPLNSSQVFAATPQGIYRSMDAGNSWVQVETGVMQSVAVDPYSGAAYAGPVNRPLERSLDGGNSWTQIFNLNTVYYSITIDPVSHNIFLGTDTLGLYRGSGPTLGFQTYNTGLAPTNDPVSVYSVAIDPRSTLHVFAGTSSGLFVSSDGGLSWSLSNTGMQSRKVLAVAISQQNPNVMFAGTSGYGVFRSTDGGATWSAAGPVNLDVTALSVDSTGQNVLAGLYVRADGFITKINPAGNALVYSTYLGGGGISNAERIAVDSSGVAYVCGTTDAADFPMVNAYQPAIGGFIDFFLARLNPAGNALLSSTYLGGHGAEQDCTSVALDPAGNIFISGDTFVAGGIRLNDFPVTASAFQNYSHGGQDCVISKFDNQAKNLLASTFLGGLNADTCGQLTVDNAGNPYVAGYTLSPDFPANDTPFSVKLQFLTTFPYSVGFVTKLKPDLSGVAYSVFIGGLQGNTSFAGIAVDAAGRAYVTGSTSASDYPFMAPALNSTVPANGKTVVSVIASDASKMVYSTLLPGPGSDQGLQIQLDSNNDAWISGNATSDKFPVTADALPHTPTTAITPYLAQLDATASTLLRGTYLAGNGGGTIAAMALGADGTIYVAGSAASTDFATSAPFQTSKTADYTLFLQHLAYGSSPPPGPGPSILVVGDAASYSTGPVCPGSVIVIYGADMANVTGPSFTTVSVNGQNIPLLYVSPGQINAQVPYETQAGTVAVRVTSNAVTSAPYFISVVPAAPGIFLTALNQAAARNADFSFNGPGNPAAVGTYISVYFTGTGPLDHPIPTGAVTPVAPFSAPTLPSFVTVGGQLVSVQFLGMTAGYIGLAQATILVPNLPSGAYPVVVTINNVPSNAPLISIVKN